MIVEHIRVAHNRERYKCIQCDSAFTRKSTLKIHIEGKHRQKQKCHAVRKKLFDLFYYLSLLMPLTPEALYFASLQAFSFQIYRKYTDTARQPELANAQRISFCCSVISVGTSTRTNHLCITTKKPAQGSSTATVLYRTELQLIQLMLRGSVCEKKLI